VRTVAPTERWLSTAQAAIDGGAEQTARSTLAWNIAGSCERPVHREIIGRTNTSTKVWIHRSRKAVDRYSIDLDTRCRRCGPCMRARAAYWRIAAMGETNKSVRTWFVTLTLSPASHSLMANRARLRLAQRCAGDFDALPEPDQFRERHNECAKELTLWLKRVRATAEIDHRQSARTGDGCEATRGARCNCHPLADFNVPLRYLLVAEAHKSGLPHYHLLVHEALETRPVRARHLKSTWRLGFSDVKLVAQDEGNRHAGYAAKYLAKSALARVRASVGYGH
jgi:hypothetical protein